MEQSSILGIVLSLANGLNSKQQITLIKFTAVIISVSSCSNSVCLFFQDSTGMKLWKKRWFVLSDLCLFYYRGESCCLAPSFSFFLRSARVSSVNYRFCGDVFAIRVSHLKCDRCEIISRHVAP